MLKNLLKQNRSYRSYDESRVISRDEFLDIVDYVPQRRLADIIIN
ncbi:hypothetical protein [Lacrimispora sp.]